MNGCGHDAQVLDDESRLPMCWGCFDEIEAMRQGAPVSMWEAATDGCRLGIFAGMFYGIGW